jgi:hypothetical protein
VTVLDLVLQITQAVPVSPRRGRVVVLEGFLQSVSMI